MPVNTRYLLDQAGWQAANPTNAELGNMAQDLATYTRQTFISAFRNDPNYRFGLVSWVDSDVLMLEIAITELMPRDTALKSLDLRAPPGEMSGGKRPHVAIEGRLRDSVTGETVFEFADRKEPSMEVYKELTWWAFAQPVIREWAAQCVTVVNAPLPASADNEPPVRLRAW